VHEKFAVIEHKKHQEAITKVENAHIEELTGRYEAIKFKATGNDIIDWFEEKANQSKSFVKALLN
jgi:hypothetical protein